MKKYLIPAGAAIALVLLTAGCESSGTAARIQEKNAVYASLTPAEQLQIQNGGIEPGYTQDMVYMSVGKPTKISTSADGQEVVWTYTNYYAPATSPQAQSRMMPLGGTATQRNAVSVESPNAPRNNRSLSATGSSGQEPGLDIPDLPSETLYVTFRDGKVVDMRLQE